jgi:glycosyltransferase involved in cell wall biosynthesis
MVVLVRCNDIVSDSRAKKYIEYYKENNIEYRIIAWDRTGQNPNQPNTIYYTGKSKYNQGGLKAVIDRIKWMVFVVKTLMSFKKSLKIHACDLDAAFPAVFFKRLSRDTQYVLFDVFDWFSDTLYNSSRYVLSAFKYMEKMAVKYSDHIIICEEERLSQIPYSIEGKYSVLQNIPSFQEDTFLYKDDNCKFNNDKTVLSYVGGFTADRCLDILIQGAVDGLYNLLIAGYGNQNILEQLERAKNSSNVKYFGKVKYTDGLRIMYNSDVIYAAYSKTNPNHFYAAPNKYYEAMFVGKPIITTKGINVAEKVVKNQIGFEVDETYNDLCELIATIDNTELKEKGAKALKMWKQFSTTTQDYLSNVYPLKNT